MLIHNLNEESEEREYIRASDAAGDMLESKTVDTSYTDEHVNNRAEDGTEELLDSDELDHLHGEEIEEYLDRVCASLVGKLPRGKREEIRERVRQRLEQFASAHRELGSTPNEAVELALAQCGAPELISNRWLPEKQITTSVTVTNRKISQKLSDRLFGSAKASTAVSSVVFGLPYIAYLLQPAGHIMSSSQEPSAMFYRAWMVGVPLLAGILAGLVSRNRPVRGVVNIVGLLTTEAIVLAGLAATMSITQIGPDISQFAGNNLAAVMCGIFPWLVFGSTGAAIGQRIRKTGDRISTRIRRAMRTR